MQLPVFQNYDCHACGYCCRNLVVNVTPAEMRTIIEAGWTERLPGERLFVEYRFRGRRLIRLAHRAGGGCVFLGDDGRCRLHAETGVASKPLACRLYPYVPTPGVGSVRLDLRADCPSVAGNRGRGLGAHRAEILALAREVNAQVGSRSPAWGGVRLDADEFDALVEAFDACLKARELSQRSRLRAGTMLLDLVMSVRPRRVRGEAFGELMELLRTSALAEAREAPGGTADSSSAAGDVSTDNASRVSPRVERLFRQWLFLHAIADDPEELSCGRLERLRRSWRRYGQSRRFAAGSGPVPPVQADWPAVRFEDVAAIAAAPDEALEPLVRSMRVKLQAHAFAGPGYFGYDLLPGLTALFLLPAVVGWLARLHAAAAGRDALSSQDVLEGVRRAHHTFGVSPVFARISERMRLRALAQPGIARSLLSRYGP